MKTTNHHHCFVFKLIVGIVAGCMFVTPAIAATFTVTSSAASGAGSFLDAYTSANVVGRNDTIVFDATAFDPATRSAAQRTIMLGASLPLFEASGLIINGDVNGDAIPDVILDGATAYSGISAVNSCVLTLQSLECRNFRSSHATNAVVVRLAATGSTLTITDSILHDNANTATAIGGGALTVLQNVNVLNIDRSVFYSNSHGLNGGAIYCVAGTATIANSVFFDNQAGGSGSANGGGAIRFQCTASGAVMNIYNCTIVGNRVPNGTAIGGGIAASSSAGTTVNIYDSIVAGNTGPGGGANDTGLPGSGVINFQNVTTGSAAGLFVNLGSGASRDLRLALGSAAIEAGGTTTTSPGATYDVLNNPRKIGSNFDRGAYEYHAARTLDLDANNSSGASGNNYSASGSPTQNVTVNGADTDTTIGALSVDSNVRGVILTLSGTLNGSSESLELSGSNPNINAVAYDSGSGRMTLYSKPAASVSDLQTAIRNVVFRNAAATPTAGTRTVSVLLSDASDSVAASASITLAAANTPPTVSANTGLTLNEGGLGSITASQLDFNDAEQADSAITYTVTALPANGQLLLNGSALALNGTFTQANLNGGAVRYAHSGTDTVSDSFTFTVSDGAGGSVTGQTFSFTVTPVNDATALAGAPTTTFTNAPGGASALDGQGGSTDIAGIALEVYFADAGLSRINSALTFEDPYSAGAANSGLAVNYANSAGSHYVIIKSRTTADNFWLQSLQLTDYGGNNVRIEAFDNGVSRGSVNVTVNTDPWYFTFDQNGALTPSIFNNADEIRIRGQNSGIIWLTINDIRIAAPVSPNTSPTFVGATTTLNVSQNSSANDIKSLLHVNDPDGAQTLTWSQSVAPTHGSLSFVSATAASGSSDITPGGTITYTPTPGYVGSDSFTVQVSDGTASATRAISVTVADTTAPTVTSVSVPANATYGAGQNLDFTVNFNEAVTVNAAGGTPYLAVTLDTGGAVQAAYVSGSGTTTLVFRYTVVSGNSDNDGIALGAAIALNGGTIQDAAANGAVLTLNSVGSTTGVLVDAVAPVITSGAASGTYGTGFAYTIAATGSPTSFGATGLPDGLSANITSGDITGTPTTNGIFNVILSATDAVGNVGSITNTFTIAKASLTATADNKSRYFNQPNPALTGSLTGNVPGDNLSASFSTSATPSSPAGGYDIVPSINDPNGRLGNYSVTLNNGTLTVTVAAPAIQLATNSVLYTIGRTPVLLAPQAGFSAPSSPSFNGGQLTVTIVSNLASTDVLGVATNGLLTATTNDASYNGNLFATYSGGTTGVAALQFTFNNFADSTSLQALLTNLTFEVQRPRNVTNFTRLVQFYFSDGGGLTSAPVLVTVILNRAPEINPDRISTGTNLPASITFTRLFQNDSDEDADPLTLIHVDNVSQQGGTVVSNATGVVYTPPLNFAGLDRFTYTMDDGRTGITTGEVQLHMLLPDQISLEIAPYEWGLNQPARIGAMGIPGQSYRLQATEDFSGWTTLETQVAPVDGFMRFFDQDATNYMHRFYRGVTP